MKKIAYIEIAMLIFVSFSPIIPIYIKILILLSLFVGNAKFFKLDKRLSSVLFTIVFLLLIISLFFDLFSLNFITDYSPLNLYIPFTFFLGFIFSRKYSKDTLLFLINKVVFIIAILSLFGVFFYTFFPQFVSKLPTYNYYHTSHKTAIFFNILLDDYGIVKRNAGIAWEPGVFQFLLNIGFYAYISRNKHINLFVFLIYALAIILTKSTMGYLVFMILSINLIKKSKFILLAYFLIFILFTNQIVAEFKYQREFKLFGSNAFEGRFEPLLNAFNLGLDNFFGIGNSEYNLVVRVLNIGSFDSYTQILIRYGFPLLVLILILLIRILKFDKSLFMIITLTFFSQSIWFTPFTTLFYFLDRKSNNK